MRGSTNTMFGSWILCLPRWVITLCMDPDVTSWFTISIENKQTGGHLLNAATNVKRMTDQKRDALFGFGELRNQVPVRSPFLTTPQAGQIPPERPADGWGSRVMEVVDIVDSR